jgi:hypothetical protein
MPSSKYLSLNFYYAKVLKLSYDHQNTMTIKETTDVAMVDLFEETIEHNKKESNPYEHYDDTYILASSVSTLGEDTRERKDHKKAGFRLWLQEKDMLEYHRMRFEFFDKVFLKRDMQDMVPLASFLSTSDVMEINDDLCSKRWGRRLRNQPNYLRTLSGDYGTNWSICYLWSTHSKILKL